MDGRPDVYVIVASVQIVESAAQVTEGAFHPVPLVDGLHFEVDECFLVQFDPDAGDIVLVVDVFSQFNGIGDHQHSKRNGDVLRSSFPVL